MRQPRSKNKYEYRPLTDNFKANMLFMSLGMAVLVVGWAAGAWIYKTSDLIKLQMLLGGFFLGSYWFSPDLDHIDNRPGKHSFPLKFLVKALRRLSASGRSGKILFAVPLAAVEACHVILNTVWRMIWQPFAAMVTHRGIIHVPIVGTLLKWYWIALLLHPLTLLPPSNSQFLTILSELSRILPSDLKGFLLEEGSLFGGILSRGMNGELAYVALGLFIADIIHISVDAWDSRGRNFVPPANIAPRGLFSKFFSALAGYWRM